LVTINEIKRKIMTNQTSKQIYQFNHLIIIEPLGFLYGSAGRFLSPENLVGRSGTSFPPSSATVSGIFAANLQSKDELNNLCIAGPFWGQTEDVITNYNFYVPTPLNYLVKNRQIELKLHWDKEKKGWFDETGKEPPADKFEKGTWIAISDWEKPTQVEKNPWKFNPHLHPRLALDQRHVIIEKEGEEKQGSLFLENAVQMPSETCLVYLASHKLESGWYRFGGEGHLGEITCQPIDENSKIKQLLKQPVGDQFALITPAIWGSNRLSYRTPISLENGDTDSNNQEVWDLKTIYTSRPYPYRYRLGNHAPPDSKTEEHQVSKNQPKLLSRGRYAVPAGTVYVLEDSLSEPWLDWDENWFPVEGVSLKRWGCGLALPVTS
jgi:CRISPR-associated protein Cmr3